MMQGSASVGHPVDVSTGAVYTSKTDFHIDGKVPVKWLRKYHTGTLGMAEVPFGPGWTSPFYARLTKVGNEYHFLTPDGTREIFPDPGSTVERGGVIRSPGTFKEISKRGLLLQITQWNPVTRAVFRYMFQSDRNGEAWPLRSLELADGQGLDLAWNEKGALLGIRQRLEKRTIVFTHDLVGRILSASFLLPQGSQKVLARYEYDRAGRLAAAYDALGSADRYEYDVSGRLIREVNRDGGVFRFKYDDAGRCIRTTGQDNYNFKSIRYFDHIGLTEVTNSRGSIQRFKWNAKGQVELEIDPLGAQTATEYDEHGRISKRTFPMGEEVAYEYDEYGNRNKITNQVGAVTQFTFNADHLAEKLLDGSGNEWQRVFDEKKRLTESRDPLGNSWSYGYDPRGLLSEIEAPDGATKRFRWDEHGNPIQSTDWEGNLYAKTFDPFGRILTSTSPSGQTVRYTHDDLGNLLREDLEDGSYIAYAYDAGGNLVSHRMRDGSVMSWKYGPCRRLLEERDPNGAIRRFTWGTEPAWLEKVINGKGQTYRFERDPLGRAIRETGFDGRTIEFEYNLSGLPVAEISATGERIEVARDPLGRIVGQTLADGSTTRFAYDPLGRMTLAATEESEVSFVRDAAGRLIKEIQDGIEIEFSLDARGNRIGLNLDGFGDFQYEYDGNGLLTRFTAPEAGSIAFQRDSLGKEVSRLFPDGRILNQSRDGAGRLIEQKLEGPGAGGKGAPELFRQFAYDLKGNVTSVTSPGAGKVEYAYDAGTYLVEARKTGMRAERFSFDLDGNRIQSSDGFAVSKATMGMGDRMMSFGAATYGYDEDGRLVSKRMAGPDGKSQDWSYTWDSLGRLRSVRTPDSGEWKYKYDALGRRISKQGPGHEERFLWDGDVILANFQEGRKAFWQFSRTDFTPICRIENGRMDSVVADHNGTPTDIIEGKGNPPVPVGHAIWGARQGGGSDIRFPVHFQGQWNDPESGLSYNRYRYYDPESARYISQDPIRLQGGVNPYRYVRNPVNQTDPFGLCDEAELDWSRTNHRGETAEEHVRLHEQNNVRKQDHGVFYGDAVDTVNAAWANRGDIEPIQIPGGNGNDVYIIPHPNAGYAGGRSGQGQNLNHVTIVTLPGTNTVVTGYPSGNGVSQGDYY